MKTTKKIMAAMGIAGICAGVSIGTYVMMQNKKKLYKQIMTYKNM